MDGVKDDKDLVIGILMSQRNGLMNQIVELELRVQKMLPLMPKEPTDDNVSQ